MSDDVDAAEREILLVEYGKAQDSAQHHDNLVGSVTSLNWLGSAVLMGFVISGLAGKRADQHKTALILLTLLGLLLTILTTLWAWQARAVKKMKYDRCKEIERRLSMRQHLQLDDERKPWSTRLGWQGPAYLALMGLFLATWIVLLADVIKH